MLSNIASYSGLCNTLFRFFCFSFTVEVRSFFFIGTLWCILTMNIVIVKTFCILFINALFSIQYIFIWAATHFCSFPAIHSTKCAKELCATKLAETFNQCATVGETVVKHDCFVSHSRLFMQNFTEHVSWEHPIFESWSNEWSYYCGENSTHSTVQYAIVHVPRKSHLTASLRFIWYSWIASCVKNI